MIRIGLAGTGHLGKIHLRLLKEIADFEVVGFYDANPETAAAVSAEFGVPAFASLTDLIDQVQALDIVTPTVAHHACALEAINKGRHVFVEKPLTTTLDEARELIARSEAMGVKAQVGHVERFNPALLAVQDMGMQPMFIEGHRLAQYNPRGTDVSVVLDLMIHDLDVVLSMVKSPVREIHASGVPVVSETPDIANARIEFENGCVANLTASRISLKNMRRLRVFQKNCYLAVDFLEKKTELIQIADEADAPEIKGKFSFQVDTGKATKYLVYEQPPVIQVNAIKMELEEFASSILRDGHIRVSIYDGYRALETATTILERIEEAMQRQTLISNEMLPS
jgi:predicted dehydrogenase